MSQLIEGLEARRFLSASPAVAGDVATIEAEGQLIKAHAVDFRTSVEVDNGDLSADLQRLGANVRDIRRMGEVRHDELRGFTKVKTEAAALYRKVKMDVHHVFSAATSVSNHRDSTALKAALSADCTKLQRDTATELAKLQSLLRSVVILDDADLGDLGAANSSDARTQTDVANEQATLAQGITTAQSDAVTLTADNTQLITDAQA